MRYTYDPYLERKKCEENGCAAKKGDNICDEECNTPSCDFDGYDCRANINPWKRCNATARNNKFCWDVFQDGFCDESCNTEECLFDGRDCDSSVMQCLPAYDAFCTKHFGNGRCDEQCNNAACGWDGLDCKKPTERDQIIPGSFYVVLTMSVEDFDAEMQQRFVRYLSLVMRTNFKIRENVDGSAMIHPFDPSAMTSANYAFNTNMMLQGNLGIVVYLEIDNVKCLNDGGEHCFENAEGYANLFGAMMGAEKLADDWGIIQVGAREDDSGGDGENSSSLTGVVIGVSLLVLVVLTLGVITQTNKRKTSKGITWFPEGFPAAALRPSSSHKRGASGEMFGKYPSTLNMDSLHDGWSDDDPTEQPAKRQCISGAGHSGETLMSGYDNSGDSRQWTQQHLNAADIRNPDILGALTPPQGGEMGNGNSKADLMANDVDVRGPMGMTPLHIASFRGGGLDTVDMDNFELPEEDNASPVQDLIHQGADLSIQMDKTGETPLHLAARYARADAAKKLLDAGADPNAQDNTGRTPLHAAVAADAQGVFHILLKHRATDLNAKTSDGTTPLILAARLAIENVVEQLIEANIEINLADDAGKTALHWAAAVNNVDAVNVLLMNNANRDATDNKDETPLFLAAKEGSYQATKALLDHGANRDIQDHMDRLPTHIAGEKMHHDIVKLLEEHIPPATQMVPTLHQQIVQQQQQEFGSPPHLMQQQPPPQMLGAKPRPKKRAPKTSISQQQPISPEENTGTLSKTKPHKVGSMKRKKAESSSSDLLSPEHSPYNGEQNYGHPLALSHPNLEEMSTKQPPSYESAVVNNAMARSIHALQPGMPGQQGLESQYSNFSAVHQQQQQQQQQIMHPRQQSMPAAVYNHLSPPHSNLSANSPPHLSPPNHQHMLSPPPPQSIQSSSAAVVSTSSSAPPPATSSSPVKSRSLQLPTSPTHMAAMRGAAMASHQQMFAAAAAAGNPQFVAPQQQQQFLYPTPPHNQQQTGGENNFLTPSPDSPATPGQWSSSSPQSHSDWSEGVHSPPSTITAQQQQMAMQQQQMLQQQTEGVLI